VKSHDNKYRLFHCNSNEGEDKDVSGSDYSPDHADVWRVKAQLPVFLSSAVEGSECRDSQDGRFRPGRNNSVTISI
jgi:hypothetical protein